LKLFNSGFVNFFSGEKLSFLGGGYNFKVRILAATGTETDVQEDNKNNLINTKDSQIPVHQIETRQQKSVNFVWPFTKLTCKNYFSNNLQEVKWVI
jgi:hypothetical protein